MDVSSRQGSDQHQRVHRVPHECCDVVMLLVVVVNQWLVSANQLLVNSWVLIVNEWLVASLNHH